MVKIKNWEKTKDTNGIQRWKHEDVGDVVEIQSGSNHELLIAVMKLSPSGGIDIDHDKTRVYDTKKQAREAAVDYMRRYERGERIVDREDEIVGDIGDYIMEHPYSREKVMEKTAMFWNQRHTVFVEYGYDADREVENAEVESVGDSIRVSDPRARGFVGGKYGHIGDHAWFSSMGYPQQVYEGVERYGELNSLYDLYTAYMRDAMGEERDESKFDRVKDMVIEFVAEAHARKVDSEISQDFQVANKSST